MILPRLPEPHPHLDRRVVNEQRAVRFLRPRADVPPDLSPFRLPSSESDAFAAKLRWYVCTGPKEPYCALFIDHPAIEMRMWLWQTWKYHVQGILIWETTWWTSPAQFKTGLQNCWRNPMSYTDQAAGAWGNGDGRFFYPPNRRPNEDPSAPSTGAPIDSLRWEMLGEGVQDWEYFHILDTLVRKAEDRGILPPQYSRQRGCFTIPDSDLPRYDPFHHRPAAALSVPGAGPPMPLKSCCVQNRSRNRPLLPAARRHLTGDKRTTGPEDGRPKPERTDRQVAI